MLQETLKDLTPTVNRGPRSPYPIPRSVIHASPTGGEFLQYSYVCVFDCRKFLSTPELLRGLRVCPEFSVIYHFLFQCSPEAFCRSIIIAITLARHRSAHSRLPDHILVAMGTLLAPTVGMMNTSGSGRR